MKKATFLISLLVLLNGCAESIALLSTGASNGKIVQSSLNSAISYSVKKQTGKTPLEHAITYADEINPEKKKEPCLSFLEKTNSEICTIVKMQIGLTRSKITNASRNDSLKNLASSLQPTIDANSKIKYLD